MPISAARARLEQHAATLLQRDAPCGLWAAAVHAVHDLLSELTGLPQRAGPDSGPLRLASGIALAPRDAANSMLDPLRTARLLQALEDAVAAAEQRFGAPVEVVYAGCGPFAPFCLLLAPHLDPARVRFTLLEVHPASLAAAGRAVAGLGLDDSVRALIAADASVYRHPGPLHVVVCEALERALEREPQVAISLNLASQLAPGGYLLPERIRVEAWLADTEAELDPAARRGPRYPVGGVLELTAASARCYAVEGLPEVVLRLPALAPGAPDELMLTTTIDLFGRLGLAESDSGITTPVFRHELGHLPAGAVIAARYVSGPRPGFRFAVRSPAH